MKISQLARKLAAEILLWVIVSTLAPLAHGQTLEVLHSFQGTDGAHPDHTALVQARDGNFYGTTRKGGDLSLNNGEGYGTVFKMTADGKLTTLAIFDGTSGGYPNSLLLGSDGNFYGTTFNIVEGYGTVFKMGLDGTLTTLVQFNGSNGARPYAGVIQASDGNFYGTTFGGG